MKNKLKNLQKKAHFYRVKYLKKYIKKKVNKKLKVNF